MFAFRLYKSSFGIRRATWVALCSLFIWRLGYEDRGRGFWQGNDWNFEWLHELLRGRVADASEYIAVAAVEVVSAIVLVVVTLGAAHWIWRGFKQDTMSKLGTDRTGDQ